MKYSNAVREKAKRLACEHGSLEKVAKIKDMPSIQTLERWAKKGKWDMSAKKDNEIAVGRERRFKSCEQLQNELTMYFNSLYEEIWNREYVAEKDENGKITNEYYEWRPALDMNGDNIYKIVRHPTITGACLSLKITQTTWRNYLNGKFDSILEKYSEVIEMARLQIEEYNFQMSYDKDKNKGALWTLERVFKYTPKSEIEVNKKTKLEDYFIDEN